MKKILIVLSVCIFSFSLLHAQGDSTKHKITLGLEVNTLGNYYFANGQDYPFYAPLYVLGGSGGSATSTNGSFSAGLRLNYYFNNNLSLKIKLGVRNYSNSFTETDNPSDPSTTLNYKQMAFYIIAGCQQSFHVNKFTDFNAGLDFSIYSYGSLSDDQSSLVVTGSGNLLEVTNFTIPGGVTVGIGPAIGLTFKPDKHIGIGAEVTDALEYEHVGGNEVETSTYFHYSGTYNYTLKGFTDSGIIASIYFSYLF